MLDGLIAIPSIPVQIPTYNFLSHQLNHLAMPTKPSHLLINYSIIISIDVLLMFNKTDVNETGNINLQSPLCKYYNILIYSLPLANITIL